MANKLTSEQEIGRMEDIIEIKNLLGKYVSYYIPGPHILKVLDLFALKTPGVSAEIADWGYFEGAEQVKALYQKGFGDTTKGHPCVMYEHDLATPIIQVAGDGKTAKGVWFCMGHETDYDKNGKLVPNWRAGKYAVAFTKEDGKWKIWKLHFYGVISSDYYKSWVEYLPPTRGLIKELNPKPSTGTTEYDPKGYREQIPPAPEPYEKSDELKNWRP